MLTSVSQKHFKKIKSDLTMFVPQCKCLLLGAQVTSKRSDKLQLS